MRAITILSCALLLTGLMAPSRAETFTQGKDVTPFSKLKNGDYVWAPQISPTGPVVIIVSIPKQKVYIYRNGIRIGRSTVSTGRPGHPTPTGVFTILQKQVDHYSTIYKGASMPYMERLTWGGIAMHAGDLPGYPDSHGCVRLPYDFAKKLYTITTNGATVIITNGEDTPDVTSHPGYFFNATRNAKDLKAHGVATDDYVWDPDESPTGPVSIVYSAKTSRVYVFRNGVEIGRAVARGGEDLKLGVHAYVALDKTDDGYRQWSSIGTIAGSKAPELRQLINQLTIPPAFLTDVRSIIAPGTTLIISDQPVNDDTKSDRGFQILRAEPLP